MSIVQQSTNAFDKECFRAFEEYEDKSDMEASDANPKLTSMLILSNSLLISLLLKATMLKLYGLWTAGISDTTKYEKYSITHVDNDI